MGSQSVPRPRTVTGVIGTSPRRSDRWAIPMCAVREEESGSVLLGGEAPLEGTLISPHSPGDACHAIGEGDGGDVVASGLGGSNSPGLECIGLRAAVSREECRPSSVNERQFPLRPVSALTHINS